MTVTAFSVPHAPLDEPAPDGVLRPTLLCVDDEPGILDAYRLHLAPTPAAVPLRSARSGSRSAAPVDRPTFRVLLAESGPHAVAIAQEEMRRGRRIQAAFFDMNLPGNMDGLETMRQVRKIDPDILCVFATASQDYSLDEIARHFPPDSLDEWDYLNKPFTANEIVQKARNLTASWFRRRHEELLVLRLDEAKRTLESQVDVRTRQLRDANRTLLQQHEDLEQLVRSKDEFLATVSHELRTPLTAVVGLAEELRDRRGLFSEVEIDEFIATIAEQSRDVAHIIEDLLVTARADVKSLTVDRLLVELRPEVDAALRSGSLHHETDRRVIVSGDDVRAWGDPARVRQILRNLIVNALRYGGSSIRIGMVSDAETARVAVCDNGDGLPDLEADRIFEPYYRAHSAPSQPGSVGLGLAVSRRLARMMGGDIRYSRHNGWTSFELSLPEYR